MSKEAFVYCWTDHVTNKLYVGSHKGTQDDGYICSSASFLEIYTNRPNDFSREIIAYGSLSEMRKMEAKVLKAANAATDDGFYNKHNGDELFYTTPESHAKSVITRKKNGTYAVSESTRDKIRLSNMNKSRSSASRKKMSVAKIGANHPYWSKDGPTKGRVWYLNPNDGKAKLFTSGSEPDGWIKGRKR